MRHCKNGIKKAAFYYTHMNVNGLVTISTQHNARRDNFRTETTMSYQAIIRLEVFDRCRIWF